MSEFEQYVEKVNNLPCTFPEVAKLNALKLHLEEWCASVRELLSLAKQPTIAVDHGPEPPLPRLPTAHRIESLLTFALNIDVELPDLNNLKHVSTRKSRVISLVVLYSSLLFYYFTSC